MKIKNYKNNNYYKIKYCNIYNFIINIIIIDKKPKHYLRINIKKFKEKLMKKKRKYNNKKYIFIKQKNMKNKFKIKNSKFKSQFSVPGQKSRQRCNLFNPQKYLPKILE